MITLRKGAREYHLLTAGEECLCPQPHAVHETFPLRDAAAAAQFLRAWRGSPAFAQSIGRLLGAVYSGMRVASAGQLEAEAARLFALGRLRVLQCTEYREHAHSVERPQAAAPPPVEAKEIKETREQRWVEFRIFDEKTGKPAPDFYLNLRVPGAPGGSTHADHGTAHLDGIGAGACDILDLSHEDVWEVTELS
jgi:hypothetical protein